MITTVACENVPLNVTLVNGLPRQPSDRTKSHRIELLPSSCARRTRYVRKGQEVHVRVKYHALEDLFLVSPLVV